MKNEVRTLSNGAKIIINPLEGAKSVAVNFGFRTGSRSERPEVAGVSHFLEHMVFKGSEARPTPKDIPTAMDAIGARYNAATSKEYTYYYAHAVPETFDMATDVIGDMVTRPLLLEAEIKKERGTVIQEIERDNDNPEESIIHQLERTAFGDTPMGREVLGSKKSVRGINHESMRRYYNEYYTGGNATAVISGKIEPGHIEKVEGYLNRLPKGEKTQWEEISWCEKRVRIIPKETAQAHFGVTIPAVAINDEKKYAAEIIATILGGYMSARLFTEIREKRGWAYRIWAYNDENADAGFLAIFGGLRLDKLEEALTVIRKEIDTFTDTVTEEELERAKSNLLGSSTLRYENPSARAKFLLLHQLLLGEPLIPEDYLKKLQAIGLTEIKDISREFFSGPKYLSLIGPFKNPEKFDKILSR